MVRWFFVALLLAGFLILPGTRPAAAHDTYGDNSRCNCGCHHDDYSYRRNSPAPGYVRSYSDRQSSWGVNIPLGRRGGGFSYRQSSQRGSSHGNCGPSYNSRPNYGNYGYGQGYGRQSYQAGRTDYPDPSDFFDLGQDFSRR